MRKYLPLIGGHSVKTSQFLQVQSPWNQEAVAEVGQANVNELEEALAHCHSAFLSYKNSSRYLRSELLQAMARLIATNKDAFSERIVSESGKPRSLAEGEVSRAVQTFIAAAEEAKRFSGEMLAIDIESWGRAYEPAQVRWVARGPVLAISPFNFPLNLVAHKVAPALAAGCSLILKPPPQAPGAAQLLGEIFLEAALAVGDNREKVPEAALQIVHTSNENASKLVTDSRIKTLSFTGSEKVGWQLQGKATRKQVVLELGGNAAVIVHRDADLKRAAARCAFGAFSYSGQVCISVQRIWMHQDVETAFTKLLIEETAKLGIGDPKSPATMVGPLIDRQARDRVLSWIDEAKQHGGKVLCGGEAKGNVISPCLLSGVASHLKLACEEVFGPVALIDSYQHIEQAISAVNSSRYGLQAGIFSESLPIVQKVADELEVGGVMINEIPTYRADHMPYGGMKDSGLGREGVRYAMEHFSERKVVISWRG